MTPDPAHTASAAFFCPQIRTPGTEYLNGLRFTLQQSPHGRHLLSEIGEIDKTLSFFAEAKNEVRALPHGQHHVRLLKEWAEGGPSAPIAEARSGIIILPLLVILQIAQYFQYLRHHGLSHEEFIQGVQNAGGVQGYCGGLPTAIAIACSKNEKEVADHTAKAVRILVGVGAYSDATVEDYYSGPTTVALRLKYEGQGDEIVSRFPGTHVSAITAPRSVSIVGPATTLERVHDYAQSHGLIGQEVDVRGRVHNPENRESARELCELCSKVDDLQFPEASTLQACIRSNTSGERLKTQSLTDEIITTVLTSKCYWFDLLNEVAQDLKSTGRSEHNILLFGMGDCVSTMPFRTQGIRLSKTETRSLIHGISDASLYRTQVHASTTLPENAIAVVGASCRLPGANNLEELWDVLSQGANLCEQLPKERFDPQRSFRAAQNAKENDDFTFYGNFIKDIRRFDNSFFGINAREAANMDPQQRLLLELSYEALEASGYMSSHRREAGEPVGCFIGASLVEYLDNTNAHPPTAYTGSGTFRAFLCGRISYYYGWSGPSEVIDTACSSSLVAINRACKSIQAGECKMALAGGVNLITGINNYLDLRKAGFLSPTGQCKPFDANADGYCRSDGGGLIVLKDLRQAVADGDTVMGVLLGAATNQGGLSSTITSPHNPSQQALYGNILRQAGFQPRHVNYVEAHGTGTQVGDPIELEGLRSFFGDPSRLEKLHVGSIKGNLGHCETAAGVAGLLKVLVMMQHGRVPLQPNFSRLNPKISPLDSSGIIIPQQPCEWDAALRTAIVNSYGIAGSNCALLCCEMPIGAHFSPQRSSPSVDHVSFPIVLSAASKTSLRSSVKNFREYLRRGTPIPRLGDLAYTLNRRRGTVKHCLAATAATVADLAQKLEVDDVDTFEYPRNPRPVVLVFSGQTSNQIALSREIYSAYPSFRKYIDAVDLELKQLGYRSLYPDLFKQEPIKDVVTLQCGIFAVQYACACSWMEAGLQPKAVIGHSIGELCALVITGVLSLSDGVKLLAYRAHFIHTKWGPEKGHMLAVQAPVGEVDRLIATVKSQGIADVEVACYNSASSTVLAGPLAAVDATERILQTESLYAKVRFKRLNTSHAFHSSLVEPILTDLDKISETLTWNEPRIPLEVCTEKHVSSMKTYSVSEHARRPVYFSNAVRRVETLLGSCVWFEAGLNTPVIPMTKQAVESPTAHKFQPMADTKTAGLDLSVTNVVLDMWHYGITLSHWSFLSKESGPFKIVWLPPYQFDTPSHWQENIDRAMEIRESLSGLALPPQSNAIVLPQLVTKKATNEPCVGTNEFLINTQCERFQKIVGGHAVRQRPLCPATMYMECVIMSIQLLLGDLRIVNFSFEDVGFQAPLGLRRNSEVTVSLTEIVQGNSWRFSIASSTHAGINRRPLIHARGSISLTDNLGLGPYGRLAADSVELLEARENVDKLSTKRAYSLFASVVHYEHFYRGISTITLGEREAVATIQLPQNQPNQEESTAWQICDAITTDTFIQVLGLLLNSSDLVSDTEVMVATAIEKTLISRECKMDGSTPWHVYAKHPRVKNAGQVTGDVFVYSPNGSLVALLLGCEFKKLQISKLEKSLDLSASIVPGPSFNLEVDVASSASSTSFAIATPSATPSHVSSESPKPSSSDDRPSTRALEENTLISLLSGYTSLQESELPSDVPLKDLGLDSLANVELVSDLQEKFNLSINQDEIFESTLNSLRLRIFTKSHHHLNDVNSITNYDGKVSQPQNSGRQSIASTSHSNKTKRDNLLKLLEEASGASMDSIQEDQNLEEIGLDSLSLTDLRHQMQDLVVTGASSDFISADTTVHQLMQSIGVTAVSNRAMPTSEEEGLESPPAPAKASYQRADPVLFSSNPFEALATADMDFEDTAKKCGFTDYWSGVSPLQNKLLIAYISEAFADLGVSLSSLSEGDCIPKIHYSPKYTKTVERLYDILESHEIIVRRADNVIRGSGNLDATSSSDLSEMFKSSFPRYIHEAALMELTGSKLASCLSGKTDPIALTFGSPASAKTMEDFYSLSPRMLVLTQQLLTFLTLLLKHSPATPESPVRILEVGAGTGGTTARLAEVLDAAGIPINYTFTDISPSFVSKAKAKFSRYPWMTFSTFDLEKEVADSFRGKFDIVISAHCVHATTHRAVSSRRIRETLKEGGIVVLCELVRVLDWYDICFGLYDGWWLAEGGTSYALQPASTWMTSFKEAGFASMTYSCGETAESQSVSLLVGCKREWPVPKSPSTPRITSSYQLETMVYKEVSGVQIHADVYLPKSYYGHPLSLALMIHGGGYMTLSRKAIRPHQTRHLLSNGFLPVSVDYRLCPEMNMVDGPMADVLDAYSWIRSVLPQQLSTRGIRINNKKVAVIGWSTGGQMAMSVGWLAKQAGLPPPTAVLSFYSPLDFVSGELEEPRLHNLPGRQMSMEKIVAALPKTPITNYDSNARDSTNLGWVRPGDPRSELILGMFKEGNALSLLLNGLPTDPSSPSSSFVPPSRDAIAAISPLAHVRDGTYRTPTFVIHGTQDEIVPFAAAERFVAELRQQGVRCGLLAVKGAKHIYDLNLKPGVKGWEEHVKPGFDFLFDVVSRA